MFVLNADLVERIDETPDTVITLVDGKKYVVAETLHEVIADRPRATAPRSSPSASVPAGTADEPRGRPATRRRARHADGDPRRHRRGRRRRPRGRER